MLKAKFVSDYTLKNIDEIKVAALYYEEIEITPYAIPLDISMEKEGITSKLAIAEKDFKESIQLLIQEKIVNYHEHIPHQEEKISLFFKQPQLFLRNLNHEDMKEFWDALEEIFGLPNARSLFKEDKKLTMDLFMTYYSLMFSTLFRSLNSNHHTITSSKILNRGINNYFNSDYFAHKKKHLSNEAKLPNVPLAFEAIKIAVPNISMLSMEDILEVRLKLKDELLFFRHQMEETQNQILKNVEYQNIEKSLSSIVDNNIRVPLIELERKMKGSRLKVLSRLLTELRTFKSYTPLIGTIFCGLPTYAAALASLGMVGTSVYLEAAQQQNEIRNNGMYYLLNLKKNYGPK